MFLGVSVVVREDGKILFTKREDFEIWCLPGGMVDDGESLEEAALREAREETGLAVEVERLTGIYSQPGLMEGGSHTAVFLAQPVGGELRGDPEETLDLRYFLSDDLPELMFWWQRPQIKDALDGGGGCVARKQEITGPQGETLDFYRLREQLYRGEIAVEAVQAMLVKPPVQK